MNTSHAQSALAEDESLLTSAVEAAGDLALSYFGREIKSRSKADSTPVSEADLAVDALLRERLMAERPSYGWLSEETADNPARLDAARLWIVDPIDGTRAFLANRHDWTVAVALVENGEPILAAVLNPARSELFLARRGGGATLNGAAIAINEPETLAGSRLITTDAFLSRDIWSEPWPQVSTIWANSIAYRLALIAAGSADGTLAISGKSEWDVAAAALLVQEAGGRITDALGAGLRFNQPEPRIKGLVAAAPALHALLVARTQPVAARGF